MLATYLLVLAAYYDKSIGLPDFSLALRARGKNNIHSFRKRLQ